MRFGGLISVLIWLAVCRWLVKKKRPTTKREWVKLGAKAYGITAIVFLAPALVLWVFVGVIWAYAGVLRLVQP